jgi:hypothetical protein
MSYRQPKIIKDTSVEELRSGANKIAETGFKAAARVKKQEELQKIKQQTLNESLYGLDLDVSALPTAADDQFDDAFKSMMNTELEKIHKLGTEALRTGDNSTYLKEKAKFAAMVKKAPSMIQMIQSQAKQVRENGPNLLNDTDMNDPMFLEALRDWDIKNGKDITPRYVNGELILEFKEDDKTDPNTQKVTKGKVFNINTGNNFQNVENGGGLQYLNVEEVDGNFKKLFDANTPVDYQGTKKSTKKAIEKDDKTLISQSIGTSYRTQNEEIRNRLDGLEKNDEGEWVKPENYRDPLENQMNQQSWQRFGFKGAWSDATEGQKKELREKIVDFMMNTYGHDDWVQASYAEAPTDKEIDPYLTGGDGR